MTDDRDPTPTKTDGDTPAPHDDIDDVLEYQQPTLDAMFEDAEDLAIAREALQEPGGIPWEDVKKGLDDLDAGREITLEEFRAELERRMAAAERGETIPQEEMFRQIRERLANRPDSTDRMRGDRDMNHG